MLPRCLTTHRLILPPPDAEVADLAAGGAPNPLPFTMQMQRQGSNWCWSAVATSVGLFFQTGAWTQCGVANGVLNQTNCCVNQASKVCDVYSFLNLSLTYTKSFASSVAEKCSLPTLESQIDNGNPVCLRCAWTGGGAHFLSVYGYNGTTRTVNVADSIYGESVQDFNTFPSSYQNGGEGGTWSHTYFTSK